MARKVTTDELIALLRTKAPNACEACGENNWVVPGVDQGGLVSLPMTTEGYRIPPPHVPAGLVVCRNCGNIRLHAMAILAPDQSGETNG